MRIRFCAAKWLPASETLRTVITEVLVTVITEVKQTNMCTLWQLLLWLKSIEQYGEFSDNLLNDISHWRTATIEQVAICNITMLLLKSSVWNMVKWSKAICCHSYLKHNAWKAWRCEFLLLFTCHHIFPMSKSREARSLRDVI